MIDDTNQPGPVEETAAIVAAQAAASAQAAQEAAGNTIAAANVAAAQATDTAAQSLNATEERLAQWQTTIQTRSEELAAGLQALSQRLETSTAETTEHLSLILKRLGPEPAPPPNPNTNAHGAEETAEAPPPPESPPPRRRAHRWT
jgi:DNA anti-recombination protein RmuC